MTRILQNTPGLLIGLLMGLDAGCRRGEPAANSNAITITSATFAVEVEKAPGLVVVDFWAAWCGPCRKISPILEKQALEYRDRIKFGKLNVDENPELANRFQITAIPCLIMFRNGKVADTLVGARTEEEYRSWFNGFLDPDGPGREGGPPA